MNFTIHFTRKCLFYLPRDEVRAFSRAISVPDSNQPNLGNQKMTWATCNWAHPLGRPLRKFSCGDDSRKTHPFLPFPPCDFPPRMNGASSIIQLRPRGPKLRRCLSDPGYIVKIMYDSAIVIQSSLI